ncbi:hypothetical protein APHNP_1359 [Anaplasma phagocytophilum str. ApNP]|uniref:Uncharacterized protein n=2 Tax=Anaplasma phagocytophilum TaxID=948 RepID=A0A0F3NFU8_ANAPH|nr:hypothetical protein APHMUC_1526 [Anaplasma phagocytophilum str. ApMUC09]KJV66925.1 hypothetical protein APHNP_1359 [Anaplasma phagocytophilum str. ApNP]
MYRDNQSQRLAVVRETGMHKFCDSTETYGFEHKKCSHNTKTMQEKKTE